jgi:hypothetical protein
MGNPWVPIEHDLYAGVSKAIAILVWIIKGVEKLNMLQG